MKLKCPLLLKPLATIVQENSQSFYPSEPFRISHFTMRHPVVGKTGKNKTDRCCWWSLDVFFHDNQVGALTRMRRFFKAWNKLEKSMLSKALKWRILSQPGKTGSGKKIFSNFSYWASSTPWGHVLTLITFCQIPVLSWAIRYSVFQKVKSTTMLQLWAGKFN